MLRILVLCLLFGTLPFLGGCASGDKEPSPEMSKNMLKLRGYKFTEEDFFRAIQSGDPAVINGFLQAGINPNAKNERGLTALTYAITNTDVKTVRILLKNADINLKDDQGNAALHLAIKRDSDSVVDLLLKHNADVNVTGRDGRTTNQSPLYAALLSEKMDLFKRLLEKGADPNISDNEGAFPLSEACLRRNADLETVELLISKGADVNKRENNGASPLIYASQNAGVSAETRNAIVKLLLDKGADKSFKDKTGKTALDWAIELEHMDTAALLK